MAARERASDGKNMNNHFNAHFPSLLTSFIFKVNLERVVHVFVVQSTLYDVLVMKDPIHVH